MLYSVAIFILAVTTLTVSAANDSTRAIRIKNDSATKVGLYWISIDTGEYINQAPSDIFPNTSLNINSFTHHTFALIEITNNCLVKSPENVKKISGFQNDGAYELVREVMYCREGRATVGMDYNMVITATSSDKGEFVVGSVDDSNLHDEEISNALDACVSGNADMNEIAIDIDSSSPLTSTSLTSLTPPKSPPTSPIKRCLQKSLTPKLKTLQKRLTTHKNALLRIADDFESYTCNDHARNTTKPLHVQTWSNTNTYSKVRDKKRTTEVMFDDKDGIQIHVISDFISNEECDAIEKQVLKKLHRATVASEDGSSKFSENRKALQSGVKVASEDGSGSVQDLTARVQRRVINYANTYTSYNITARGQEDIMSIHYTGRGLDDKLPDQYMPHCDGDCNGDSYRLGMRVATMVIYCGVPEVGGATNFKNVGIHVKPTRGSATFFSYVSNYTEGEGGMADTGLTLHSGCPVYVGTKKIVTQWLRKGVDGDVGWEGFNTMGVKKGDEVEGEVGSVDEVFKLREVDKSGQEVSEGMMKGLFGRGKKKK